MTTLVLPQFPETEILVAQYDNVKNAGKIREELVKGNLQFNYAFINAETVTSETHLNSAIYRTLINHKNKTMKAKTMHSELIFNLSPFKNIMDALKKFGIADECSSIIVVRIPGEGEAEPAIDDLDSVVEGDRTEEPIGLHCNTALVKKIFKLNGLNDDLDLSTLISGSIQLR
ncbi:BA75_04234T0 [Komagataella pastoris]|uniref:EKC/KEOPS complex subunit CGI121 n=1 Tax=Komagataella pastoris TaxID=4922 RepID=A0A1B2JGE0_PICPA|nr:BA75_04234T0 [Komagataella pastoris]